MEQNEEVRKNVLAMPDHRLLALLEEAQDYTEFATSEAEHELLRRGMDPVLVEIARKKGLARRQDAAERAEVPLPAWWMALMFFAAPVMWIPVLVILARKWTREGFSRKSMDAYLWLFAGIVLWAALLTLAKMMGWLDDFIPTGMGKGIIS